MLYQQREIIKKNIPKQSVQYQREVTGIPRMVLMGGTREITVQKAYKPARSQGSKKEMELLVTLVFMYEVEIDT